MSLDRSELEFKSLFLYLKETILAQSFSIEVQDEPLKVETRKTLDGQVRADVYRVDPETSAFGTLPTSNGRGWLSFEPPQNTACEVYDPTTSGFVSTYGTPLADTPLSIPTRREESLIIVRDQFYNEIPRDYYRIDYEKGRIRWPASTTPSGALTNIPTTIDYRFHMVSLIEGYPTDEEPPQLPVIAIYPIKEKPKGFQIGPGVASCSEYAIDVFATSEVEKRKILSGLKKVLHNKNAPVIDFNRTGMPLTQWGAVNQNFIQEIDFKGEKFETYLTLNSGNGQILYFVDLEVMQTTAPRTSITNLTRHMGGIKLMTKTYTDRDPDLVGKFNNLNPPFGGLDSLVKKSYSS